MQFAYVRLLDPRISDIVRYICLELIKKIFFELYAGDRNDVTHELYIVIYN